MDNQTDLCLAELEASYALADEAVEVAFAELRELKQDIKALQEKYQKYQDIICDYMQEREVLVGSGGEILATWKPTKSVKRFDQSAFRECMPDLYESFCATTGPQRRFVVIK